MIKALIKKQMLEVFALVYKDNKTGKSRDKKGVITYVLLYLAVFCIVAFMFYNIADIFGDALLGGEYAWLYMAIMGMLGLIMAVFGSVFNTYSSLYKVKDNDLLLSMPIPSNNIIFVRLLGVYVMGLLYELIVMIPVNIVYLQKASPNVFGIIFTILIPFVLSIIVLSLSCILGLIVAILSDKLKNQKILTVILALILIAGYYVLCGSAEEIISIITQNPSEVAKHVKGIFAIFYHMGLASEGNVVSMLMFTTVTIVVFALIYMVLKSTFLKMTITNSGTGKVKYVEKNIKTKSVSNALLGKEITRFLQSANYMLNCGLGIVFMVVVGVVSIVQKDKIVEVWSLLKTIDWMILLVIAAIALMCSMNNMAAASISLEGKNIWVLQSLPVSSWEVIKAKSKVQFLFTIVPAMFLTACMVYVLRPTFFMGIMMFVIITLFVVFVALFDVACNLKFPNLTWTSEATVIKQSMSVAISLFASWIIVAMFCGIFYLLHNIISIYVYTVIVSALLVLFNIGVVKWLKNRGCKIFETL